MEPLHSGKIEAADHWDAIQRLGHLKPADFTLGNMPWCKLSDATNKVQHYVFIDGSVTDQVMHILVGNNLN
jgi:hypothetical protein